VLDAFLALFLTGALAAYYAAIEENLPAHRRTYLLLCGAACAGAFLVKGFVALAIAVVVAAPYLAARRDWRTLLASPWLPMAAAAALALPWAVLIQLREPDFWHYFFWVEHIQRFAGSDAQHTQPFWYYIVYLPLTGFPWILFLPAALIGLRGGRNDVKFLGYLAAWVLLPLLFLSLAKGKLLTYILPCFAPLSILLAAGLERYLAGPRQRAFRAAAALLAVVFVTMLAALLALQRVQFGGPLFSPTESPKLAMFAGSMIAGAGCAIFAFLTTSRSKRLVAIAAIGAALVLPLQVALPDRVLELVAPATAIARYSNAAPDAIIVSDARLFGATAWSLKRDDIYVVSPGEIEYGLSYPEDRARRLDGAQLERLIAENRGHREIVIVIWLTSETAIERQLPPAARREQHGDVILWRIPV
jgi:4-amino-4-deoxy-L-arabinose transferase